MLTDREKKWLEEREKEKQNNGYYFCAHSELRSAEWNTKTGWADVYWVIETKDDFRDAAEFAARVAAKIAHDPCPCFLPPLEKCAKIKGETMEDVTRCRLKHARLAVEAEMEKEGK